MIDRLNGRNLAAYVALLLVSAACAHAPPPAPGVGLSKADMKFRAVYVEDFSIAPKGVAEDDPKPHVASARAACLEALGRSGLFDTVKPAAGDDPKEGALIARAELTSLRIVGGAARFWAGAFAGKSDMRFQVTLLDATTGAVVTKSEVSEDTNAWGGAWTMGATDKSLPGEVGTKLAEFVVFGAKK
jgi:hypothetical protein